MNSQKFNNVISLSNLVGKTQQITSKSCELNLEKYLTSLYYIYIYKASIKILYTTFHNLIHRIIYRPLHTSRVSSKRSQESRVQKQGLRVPLPEKPSLGFVDDTLSAIGFSCAFSSNSPHVAREKESLWYPG